MFTIQQLLACCEQLAPLTLAESYDNVGLLVGDPHAPVSRVICALDLNEEVIEEAHALGVQCIITHHPFIFSAFKRIDLTTAQGRMIKKLLTYDIHVIAMHTNLDIARGGINDYLATQLGLEQTHVLKETGATTQQVPYGIGRWGKVQPTPFATLLKQVKAVFDVDYVRVVGTPTRPIESIAICSGSGASFIRDAARVADVYITGDIGFHEAQAAREAGIVVIDVGHYASEHVAMPLIKSYLNEMCKQVYVYLSNVDGEMFQLK